MLFTAAGRPMFTQSQLQLTDEGKKSFFELQKIFIEQCKESLPSPEQMSMSCFQRVNGASGVPRKNAGGARANIFHQFVEYYKGQIYRLHGDQEIRDGIALCMAQCALDVALENVSLRIDSILPDAISDLVKIDEITFMEVDTPQRLRGMPTLKDRFPRNPQQRLEVGHLVYGSRRDCPFDCTVSLKDDAASPPVHDVTDASEAPPTDDLDRCLLCFEEDQPRLFSCTRETIAGNPCKFALCRDCSIAENLEALNSCDGNSEIKCPQCRSESYVFKRSVFAKDQLVYLRAPVAISATDVVPQGSPGVIVEDYGSTQHAWVRFPLMSVWNQFSMYNTSFQTRTARVPDSLLARVKTALGKLNVGDAVVIESGSLAEVSAFAPGTITAFKDCSFRTFFVCLSVK